MGYRQEILTQLYRILERNTTDARIYYRLADRCKRSYLKYFFKKLSLHKRIFCRRIRYEIRELEKEIELIGGNKHFRQIFSQKHNSPSPTLARTDMIELITYCYKREREYLEIYKDLLSRTNFGNIREMLLAQKHSAQLVVNEIKNLENKIHNGKSGGEVNYS